MQAWKNKRPLYTLINSGSFQLTFYVALMPLSTYGDKNGYDRLYQVFGFFTRRTNRIPGKVSSNERLDSSFSMVHFIAGTKCSGSAAGSEGPEPMRELLPNTESLILVG